MWEFMFRGLLRSFDAGPSVEAPPGRGLPRLVAEACTPCDACFNVCPTRAFGRDASGKTLLDVGACLQCGLCVATCPTHALQDGGFELTATRQRSDLLVPLADVPGARR